MRPDEIAALGDLAGDAAAGATEQIRDVHTGIARRVWRRVGPACDPGPDRPRPDRRWRVRRGRRLTGALARAGAQAVSARTAAMRPRSSARRRAGCGRRAQRRLRRHARPARQRAGAADDAPPPRPRAGARAARARRRLPAREARVSRCSSTACARPTRPGTATRPPARHALRPPAAGRARLHARCTSATTPAGTSPRTAASWRAARTTDRGVAGRGRRDRADRPLDGRAGRAQRLPLRRRQRLRRAKVRHVVTLGAPHRGAPLEQVAPTPRAPRWRGSRRRAPFANALNIRSVGDQGSPLRLPGRRVLAGSGSRRVSCATPAREVPFLPTANTTSSAPRCPASRTPRSAGSSATCSCSGRARGPTPSAGTRMRFPVEHYFHLGGANHFDLLNHPAIYAQIRRCVQRQRALPAPVPAGRVGSAPVALAPEHELLGQRDARRRRGVGEHRDGLGDAAR